MSHTHLLLADAIRTRSQVVALYKGHARLFCPHALAEARGRVNLLVWQFGGGSTSGLAPDGARNWRRMHIDELTDVTVHPGPWHTAPEPEPAQPIAAA